MRRFGYRSQKRVKQRLIATALLLCMALIGSILLIDARLRPTIQMFSSYQAKVFATRAINDAIYTQLETENIRYDNLVHLVQNENGQITALQTDMVALNQLRSKATSGVLDSIAQMENQIIRVPMGTLSGIALLSGRGPAVEMKVVPSGYLTTQVENRFDSAGINQTRHQIMLVFDLSVTSIVPGFSVTTQVSTRFCLAETVIVGVVPEAFTSVVGEDASSTRQIFDYRAEKARQNLG